MKATAQEKILALCNISPPANAGDRFDPWSRKIPHAVEQVSRYTTAIKPVLQSPRATIAEPTSCNY